MEKNEVKKELYIEKTIAKMTHYRNGKLYYEMIVSGVKHQLSIDVTHDDTKGADFGVEMEARLLWRWIDKGIDKGDFVRLSL